MLTCHYVVVDPPWPLEFHMTGMVLIIITSQPGKQQETSLLDSTVGTDPSLGVKMSVSGQDIIEELCLRFEVGHISLLLYISCNCYLTNKE